MKKLNKSAGRTTVVVALLLLSPTVIVLGQAQQQRSGEPGAELTSGGPLKLNKGDRIALIGNTLADRMQHDGWLETLIHARFPRHELVVRNLAVAGDEVVTRARSMDFGTPDEWLTKVGADVIFAFFGFNESFKGEEGLPQFKADLDQWIKETAKKNYGGKGPPRIVLFSPVANERHRDPNRPDPSANNKNIALYAAAMAEVAKANGVQFVDLFAPSQTLYAQAAREGKSLTHNALHLTEEGGRLLAPQIFRRVFDETAPEGNFEKLRNAVNEKSWQWHQRYRTIDGYNVYGGRSREAYEQGPGGPRLTNFKVMQEEMAQRDVLTANREKRVWAVARGGDLKVDDANLPPVTPVKSNRRGPNPDGSFTFLGGEEAIAKMTLAPGLKINLFADEKQFPELVNPVQMAWDTKGRLWVAVWPNYPERTPTSKKGDSLLVFEDTDRDGRADKCTPFLDDLNAPTGFQFYKDGVLVMQAPDLWFVRDTNGDGKGDWKERVLMGLDSADSHHTTNSMCYEPGGAVYLSDGVFHRTQVETPDGPVRNIDGAVYRFEPRTGRFDRHVDYGFANPHGRAFDYWGNDLITDATGNNTYFAPAFSGRIDFPQKHKTMRQFWERPSRPSPGTHILTSRHFPDDWQGTFLNINVIGFQGIYRVKVKEEGSGLWGETIEPHLISSTDPNFRPIVLSTGPDGALYFADWHNPLIGHLQHHLRDPNRDHRHGRVYRITCEGRPLMTPAKIDGQPVAALLDLLKEPENQTRELAKIELDTHDTAEVMSALREWVSKLDRNDPNYQHHLTEALWLHQWHNVVNADLLTQQLNSPEPRARAAATRVLCYWRDRVPEVFSLLKARAEDESPRVRLEAVRAASFFRDAQAVDVALAALKHPTDYYLDYTLGETMRQLEPYWRKALAQGKPVSEGNEVGLQYLMRSVSAAELLKLPKTPAVLEATVLRPDVSEADRGVALFNLSELRKTTRADILLGMIDALRTKEGGAGGVGIVARLLPQQPAGELQAMRDRLEALTTSDASADVRQAAWGAIALADNSFDKVWARAAQSPATLRDLIAGIPLIYDPDVRNMAYDRVMPLLTGQAQVAQAQPKGPAAPVGRFVRIELPRRGTLTLAEVQVFSGGQNIAMAGKAAQSSTSNGGEASRAIDGRTDGSYGSGTQTHTAENERRPWWEVDLGGEKPIESVVVWNRTESAGRFAQRLNNFTLTVLDGSRREVFRKEDNPAPAQSARIALGQANDPDAVRRAAVAAAVSMNRDPAAVFAALAKMIETGDQLPAATRGIRTLPRPAWDKARSGAVANALVAWVKKLPAGDRTTPEALEAVQLAGDLAGVLPAEQQAALRKELKDLRVAVFLVRTVREQMRYDTPRLVVEAGKPFEIILENADFMPHNLVVVNPGAREKIGTISGAMTPDQLDNQGRAFVPRNPDVLGATRLLEAGQRQALKMTAPTKEGDYDYVCTYPGHWQLMWGRLVVTRDVDAYLQAHPDAGEAGPGTGAGAAGHEHHGGAK